MKKSALVAIAFLLLTVGVTLIWHFTPLHKYATIEGSTKILKTLKSSEWAMISAVGLYTVAGLCFFPIIIMTGAAVIVFGPLEGVAISFAGAILIGLVTYGLGRAIGEERLNNIFGEKISRIFSKIRGAGVAGVALIRVVPAGPYPLVNMVFGAAEIPLLSFLIGTVIGLAPGKLALALTGDGILKIFDHPTPENIFYLSIGLALWIGVILFTHKMSKSQQKKHQPQGA